MPEYLIAARRRRDDLEAEADALFARIVRKPDDLRDIAGGGRAKTPKPA
jgi:hypothetical protein